MRLYPLPTRINRLGLLLRPEPTLHGHLRYRLVVHPRTGTTTHLSVGPFMPDATTALLAALATHPLGQTALWPPLGAVCGCRGHFQEH